MTIQQNNNGRDGAEPSSHQNSFIDGIQSPANNSYQQSMYISTIAVSLGFEGLVSPVRDKRDGIEYTFDFYQPEEKRLFKIFHRLDEEEYRLYAGHPSKPILIFDISTVPCRMEMCECGADDFLIMDKAVAVQLYDNPNVVIYREGRLWEYHMHVEGKWVWKIVDPYLLRELRAASANRLDLEHSAE